MILFLRLFGLAWIASATAAFSVASLPTLAALGIGLLIGLAVMGFGLCVMAGQISSKSRDEANGKWDGAIDPEAEASLKHPLDLEGKN